LNKHIDELQFTLVIYVDYILILATQKTHIDQVITMLKRKFKNIKSKRGINQSYLGMRLEQQQNMISVETEAYIQEVLNKYNSKIAKKSSPGKTDIFAINKSSTSLQP
jgi:Reverse transcriptase (RNA-dependent DNA polymerase)